jgi:iron complex outermembrane recepter protein
MKHNFFSTLRYNRNYSRKRLQHLTPLPKQIIEYRYLLQAMLFLLYLIVTPGSSAAQTQDTLLFVGELKKMSLEELMNIEVTSVSKHPEKLKEVASAIQIITQNDIRSSGVKTLPEALRLAPNLLVAQVNSSQWAISSRGFNNVLANKLLVLIDGRNVFTPLYAGVFWDVQNVLLEDVDRIEVISGPGGTLWGANAVNGVINIITKNSKSTNGLFAEGAAGTALPGLGSLRYGDKLTDNFFYRVYATGFNMGNTILSKDSITKTNAKDEWSMVQGGARFDWDITKHNLLTLQSNVYEDNPNPDGGIPVIARGNNVLAQWVHKTSGKSEFQLQGYYDHTWRDFNNGFTEDLKTYDLDWHNQYKFNRQQVLSCGFGFRLMDHEVQNLPLFAFLPAHKILELYSSFLQDEITLITERLHLTLGTKIEYNSYTHFEYQPNSRLTWTPTRRLTLWTAISRAVRTPARIDRDFFLYLTPTLPYISGSTFKSEEVVAYETGWRYQPLDKVSFSLSTFYNVYDNIRNVEPGPPPFNIPITFHNGVKGETYGSELSVIYQPVNWWHLRGGHTFLKKNLWVKYNTIDLNNATAESNDPKNQFLIQSTVDIMRRIQLGTVLRRVDKLPRPYVPAYTGLDMRIGWKMNSFLEISVVAQNILDDRHPEFVPASPSPREIRRSMYGKVICTF